MSVVLATHSSTDYRGPLAIQDSFPKKILETIEKIESLRLVDKTPTYAPNLYSSRCGLNRSSQEEIKRGVDQSGRPFLEIHVPGFYPFLLHTYTNCSTSQEFTNLKNWQITLVNQGMMSSRILAEKDLPFISQISQGNDLSAAYKELCQHRRELLA